MPDSLDRSSSVADWQCRLGLLHATTPPCPGLRSGEWADLRERGLAFLAAHGERAAALGWGVLDLFGVHPQAGASRVDYCGSLMLPSVHPVGEITATTMKWGPLTYYRVKPPRDAVAVWDWKEEAVAAKR